MEPSPLTQQTRPESFTPKIEQLYHSLLHEDDTADDEEGARSEGFWQEFFLLKPELGSLRRVLADLRADDLLNLQNNSHQLFSRAIQRVKAGTAPCDENALDTLTVFLGGVLSKKYTNPSSDIISVLAGLHHADAVFSEFVGALDAAMRGGRDMNIRLKAVRVALSVTSGAYQTGLISYFTHRDLFPSLMKLVQDSEDPSQVREPFILLGLLANYNKFEFQNPYRMRLDDFVNDTAIRTIIHAVGATCAVARDRYVAVQDDVPEGWNLGSTLSYIGLGALAPGSRPSTPSGSGDEAKQLFTVLPGPEMSVLLATFDFVNANKLFCFNLVNLPPASKSAASPLSSFLSLASYLVQHAHRSSRASLYTSLVLFILQILVEDQVLMKRLCGDESKSTVRLCRQRQPFLPIVRGERVGVAFVIDVAVDGINHNLRKRLDVDFYLQCIGILNRIVSFLGRSRTRLAYHWSELWRSLLSFIRFLTTYADDLRPLRPAVSRLAHHAVNLVALALSSGEAFLPDAAAFDDLFYKLVESGDILPRFRDAYDLSSTSSATALASPSAPTPAPASNDGTQDGGSSSSVDTLISVSAHYHGLLAGEGKTDGTAGGGGGATQHLSPKDVGKVITRGYETLSIQARDGLDRWERFREAEHRVVMKKVARVAVGDARVLVEGG